MNNQGISLKRTTTELFARSGTASRHGSRATTWAVAGTMALLVTLPGCSSGGSASGDDPEDLILDAETRPVAVLLRPGESEEVETTVTPRDPDSWATVEYGDAYIELLGGETGSLHLSAVQDCTLPPADEKTGCFAQTVTAETFASAGSLHTYDFEVAEVTPGPRRYGSVRSPISTFPASPAAAAPVVELAAGPSHALALTADGSVWAWGSNTFGQLGDGTQVNRSQPVRLSNLSKIIAIAGGEEHSLAVDSGGAVWAWGDNGAGKLGDGTNTDRRTPVQVSGLSNIVAVAAGGSMSYALRDDGQVFGWGTLTDLWVRGDTGERVYTENTYEPVPIPTASGFLDGIKAIAAGGVVSEGGFLALDDSNRVWLLDVDFDDDDFYTIALMGVKSGLPDIREIAVGGEAAVFQSTRYDGLFYLALDFDNRVWSWGYNDKSQLGRVTDGSSEFRPPIFDDPAIIPGLTNVSHIAAGGAFGMAAVVGDPVTGEPEGSVWIWGDASYGQQGGLGLEGLRQEPAPLHALSAPLINNDFDGVKHIAAGARHALAVSVGRHLYACQEAGTGRDLGSRVYAWGDNLDGQRGDGTAINALGATPVLTLGDDDTCVTDIGHRLVVYKQGAGDGTVTSDADGIDPTTGIDQTLYCRGIMCWQNVPAGTTVTLTATPDEDTSAAESQWQWDCTGFPGIETAVVQVNGPTHCKIRFGPGSDTPAPLTAEFTVTPNPATAGAGIVFDASASTGDIANYQWDFEDDGTFDASGQSVNHSYAEAGTYAARLRVTDDEGNTSGASQSVNVTEAGGDTALLQVEVTGPGTVMDADGGILCGTGGTDCSEDVPLGRAVLLTPIPDAGTDSIDWTGCDEDQGAEGCLIQSMDGPRVVTATFSANPP